MNELGRDLRSGKRRDGVDCCKVHETSELGAASQSPSAGGLHPKNGFTFRVSVTYKKRIMPDAVSTNQGTNKSTPPVPKPFGPEDESALREALKRCSPSTFEAAVQFRKTGNPEHVPAVVIGVIERFVEPDLRMKLKDADDDLRLVLEIGLVDGADADARVLLAHRHDAVDQFGEPVGHVMQVDLPRPRTRQPPRVPRQ